MNEVTEAKTKTDRVLDLVAAVAASLVANPGPEAWSMVLVELGRQPWVTSKAQHELRPQVWTVRGRLRKHIAATAGLTDAQIRTAAREIAISVVPTEVSR
jgi:hypothetical protein